MNIEVDTNIAIYLLAYKRLGEKGFFQYYSRNAASMSILESIISLCKQIENRKIKAYITPSVKKELICGLRCDKNNVSANKTYELIKRYFNIISVEQNKAFLVTHLSIDLVEKYLEVDPKTKTSALVTESKKGKPEDKSDPYIVAENSLIGKGNIYTANCQHFVYDNRDHEFDPNGRHRIAVRSMKVAKINKAFSFNENPLTEIKKQIENNLHRKNSTTADIKEL